MTKVVRFVISRTTLSRTTFVAFWGGALCSSAHHPRASFREVRGITKRTTLKYDEGTVRFVIAHHPEQITFYQCINQNWYIFNFLIGLFLHIKESESGW